MSLIRSVEYLPETGSTGPRTSVQVGLLVPGKFNLDTDRAFAFAELQTPMLMTENGQLIAASYKDNLPYFQTTTPEGDVLIFRFDGVPEHVNLYLMTSSGRIPLRSSTPKSQTQQIEELAQEPIPGELSPAKETMRRARAGAAGLLLIGIGLYFLMRKKN